MIIEEVANKEKRELATKRVLDSSKSIKKSTNTFDMNFVNKDGFIIILKEYKMRDMQECIEREEIKRDLVEAVTK